MPLLLDRGGDSKPHPIGRRLLPPSRGHTGPAGTRLGAFGAARPHHGHLRPHLWQARGPHRPLAIRPPSPARIAAHPHRHPARGLRPARPHPLRRLAAVRAAILDEPLHARAMLSRALPGRAGVVPGRRSSGIIRIPRPRAARRRPCAAQCRPHQGLRPPPRAGDPRRASCARQPGHAPRPVPAPDPSPTVARPAVHPRFPLNSTRIRALSRTSILFRKRNEMPALPRPPCPTTPQAQ